MINTNTFSDFPISMVQILRNGQITLPIEIRRFLKLERGGFLNIKLKNNQVLLTPQTITDEAVVAKDRFFTTINKIREKNKDIPLEEIEKAVNEAVLAIRSGKE